MGSGLGLLRAIRILDQAQRLELGYEAGDVSLHPGDLEPEFFRGVSPELSDRRLSVTDLPHDGRRRVEVMDEICLVVVKDQPIPHIELEHVGALSRDVPKGNGQGGLVLLLPIPSDRQLASFRRRRSLVGRLAPLSVGVGLGDALVVISLTRIGCGHQSRHSD
jgi:hypothetical protein